MAVKVKKFEIEPRTRRNSKYAWDQWMDGKIWEIRQGEDFDIHYKGMRSSLYMRANKNGLSIKSVVLDNGKRIQFQFSPK